MGPAGTMPSVKSETHRPIPEQSTMHSKPPLQSVASAMHCQGVESARAASTAVTAAFAISTSTCLCATARRKRPGAESGMGSISAVKGAARAATFGSTSFLQRGEAESSAEVVATSRRAHSGGTSGSPWMCSPHSGSQ